jgi:hypothetical protein
LQSLAIVPWAPSARQTLSTPLILSTWADAPFIPKVTGSSLIRQVDAWALEMDEKVEINNVAITSLIVVFIREFLIMEYLLVNYFQVKVK